MDNLLDKNESNIPEKAGKMLRLLCVLTFIWSGLGVFQNLTYTIFLDPIRELIPQIEMPKEYEVMKDGVIKLISAGRLFFFLGLILNISSLIGAAMMLKMKKSGFHFYAIAQILLLMLPMIFIKGVGFASFEFLITAVFIAMYAAQTKALERK